MFQKYLLLVLAVLFLFSCEKVKKIGEEGKSPYRGKVKSCSEVEYEAVLDNGKIVRGKRKKYLSWFKDITQLYNKDGYLIQEDSYDTSDVLVSSRKFLYDELGFLKESNYEGLIYGDGVIINEVYAYDHKKRLETVTSFKKHTINPNQKELTSRWVYLYDSKGNNTEKQFFYSGEVPISRDLFVFDDSNQIIENTYYEDGDKLKRKEYYKYDSRGNKIEVKNETINYLYKYKYDKNNNQIEQKSFKAGKLVYHRTSRFNESNDQVEYCNFAMKSYVKDIKNKYVYKYDKKGNWVERVNYVDGEPKFITIRDFQYYD